MSQLRADKKGTHRAAFDRNKKKLLKTATICGICGKLVDKSL
ncbi:TPA: HNH endonuclease, partial [Streptococcus pyogenes]|nr:HNH endonuclease [Streptococcus pyogenes]